MKSSQSRHAWLHAQLDLWQKEALLPVEMAETLRHRYPLARASGHGSVSWMTVILGVFGSALIMGGIILLFAHNWHDIPRFARTVISITPMLVFQGLGLWIVRSGNDSAAWREGVGMGLTLSIGAAIALVAQTYQLGGDFSRFMLVWTLLTLPVIYLLRAGTAFWLYLLCALFYAGYELGASAQAPVFYLLLLLAVPFAVWMQRMGQHRTLALLCRYALALAVWIGFPMALEYNSAGVWLPILSCIGGAMILWDRPSTGRIESLRLHPFAFSSALVFAVSIMVFSFEDVWREYGSALDATVPTSMLLLLLGVLAVWVCGVVYRVRVCDWWSVGFGGSLPILGFAAWSLSGKTVALMLATNALGLGIGVAAVVVALRDKRLSLLNYGLFLVGGLVVLRFFDSDLGFVPRGLAFIGIGSGFLATNYFFVRSRRSEGLLNGDKS